MTELLFGYALEPGIVTRLYQPAMELALRLAKT